jgi:hypothetical protein
VDSFPSFGVTACSLIPACCSAASVALSDFGSVRECHDLHLLRRLWLRRNEQGSANRYLTEAIPQGKDRCKDIEGVLNVAACDLPSGQSGLLPIMRR